MKTPSTEHEAVIVKTEEGDDRKRFTRRIPTSWEEASPEDQMLITMKEAGEGWLSIRTAWEHMTGTETGSSTLPIRYSRIIAHRTHLAEGDVRTIISGYPQCLSVKRLARSKSQHSRIFFGFEMAD